MIEDVFVSTGFNICMLVVLAYVMTKLDFVKRIILNREMTGLTATESRRRDIMNRVYLGILMGAFCMVSNFIGFQTKTAIPNARVIGALSAGMLGGPISGTIASVMGALHRYLGDPARITTPPCVLATLLQGVFGSFLWYKKKHRMNYGAIEIYLITMSMEIMHMGLIYLMARPMDQALHIIAQISPSMIFINPLGMILVFGILKDTFEQADSRVAVRISDSFRIAERCIPYLKNNGDLFGEAKHILNILMEETQYAGAAIIRGDEFLARTDAFKRIDITGCVIKGNTGRYTSDGKFVRDIPQDNLSLSEETEPVPRDPFQNLRNQYVVYIEDIAVGEKKIDQLVILGKKDDYSNRADIAFIKGLASLFSTYMKIAELDEQKDLRRKAELQALQAQINPHFLFNALNTISFFCREKPEKARELLLALSTYFRNSLQEADTMIPLEQEISHVKAYLMLEEARFEERLKVEIDLDPEAMSVQVPNLILQPLVENAVKHGAKTRERGMVKIHVYRENQGVTVDILDNGPGIPEAVVESLHGGERVQKGIGFINVHKRLTGIFGPESGLQVSHQDDMTQVRVWIPES
ncbi:MAG: LytS/YhcK type 5TM receptor domain-containing protein [Clostridiales bacterium]|nr:LytS/YhcK type 5TM receptor domain-containing protein [Clostridiales bacterium]